LDLSPAIRPRASPPGGHVHAADPHAAHRQAAQWGVRIAARSRERACPQVLERIGKEFPVEHKPLPPVEECPCPRACGRHCVELFDRRKADRRSGKERRSVERFENGHHDRRSGHDRRGKPAGLGLRSGVAIPIVASNQAPAGRRARPGAPRVMKRRAFLSTCAGFPLLWAVASRLRAQSVPIVGFLNSASATTYSFNAAAFLDGLREAGYVENQNVAIEYRWANNDYARLPALAVELVSRGVAVIAATGDIASARAAQSATMTIPIVFTVGSDPVPFGLVTSLSRPTGNATGVTLFSSTLMAKRLELLREVIPSERTVALLMNPDNVNYPVDLKAAQAAAEGFGRVTVVAEARNPGEIAGAFDTILRKRAGAVLVASDPMFLGQRDRVAALALENGLPVVAWTREFAEAGILLSYGTSIQWMYREAGGYVGRILRGAKPSDLPVIQPSKFDLVINLKTARALGLTVPTSLLLRADEVIR